jgi:hypothetical protein
LLSERLSRESRQREGHEISHSSYLINHITMFSKTAGQ